MFTFAMNAGNFGTYLGGGQCAGVRLDVAGVVLDSPERVAGGTFTSPVFDAGRMGAKWLVPEWSVAVPARTTFALETRAGDTLDGQGQVAGPWRAAGAAERGRYAQWRATLARAEDAVGTETPVLSAVAATASAEGYNVYHGVGAAASAIDYGAPVAQLGPVCAWAVAGLAFPAVHWFGVRTASPAGLESRTVEAEARLELNAAGGRVAARPAGVESLAASGAGGGRVRLAWLALAEMGEARPDVFRVYTNGGSGAINFAAPVGAVAWAAGRRRYEWTSAACADGATVRFAVRAETAAGGVDALPAEVETTVDATEPRGAGFVAAEAALSD
jgi:hypothetical protein